MHQVWQSPRERLYNSDEGRGQRWCYWESIVVPGRQLGSWLTLALGSLITYLGYVVSSIDQAFRLFKLWTLPNPRPCEATGYVKVSRKACCTFGHEAQSRGRLWYENFDQGIKAQTSILCTLCSMALATLWEISDHERPHHWAFEKQRRLVLGTLDGRVCRIGVSFMSERNDIEPWRLTLSSLVLPRRTIHSMKPGPSSGSDTQAKIERGCKKKCVYFCDFPLCLLTVL